jgi:hypothetical protein
MITSQIWGNHAEKGILSEIPISDSENNTDLRHTGRELVGLGCIDPKIIDAKGNYDNK